MTSGEKDYYLRYQEEEELEFLRLLLDKHGITPKGIALDAGCGYGFFTHLLSKVGYDEVTGFDLDNARIDEATKTYGANDDSCKFKVGDATDPPFEKESFDLVFCRGLSTFYTENISFGKKQFEVFFDLLKPNAFLVLICASDLSGKITTGKIINHKIPTMKKFFDASINRFEQWQYFIFAKHYSTKMLGRSMFNGTASTLAVLLTTVTKRQGYIIFVIRKAGV